MSEHLWNNNNYNNNNNKNNNETHRCWWSTEFGELQGEDRIHQTNKTTILVSQLVTPQ